MSPTTPSITLSDLGFLPAEIFNRVLAFVLDPVQSEVAETPTTFRDYRLDTAILRVNKGAHEVAKSYLHHGLAWVLPTHDIPNKILALRSTVGTSMEVRILSGQHNSRYKFMVDRLKILSGPFHEISFTGGYDTAHTAAVGAMVEMRRLGQDHGI
ncbi:hypothetical protein EK21DRAFT_118095 [Setomelanomma holmii]|uniref:Uncharacterized protein n=1 Tax=Setomelanomma holmii TaxID=210430 RepID=A0A9P4GWS0_9PLEO|nr:hypothetical protein EK21DRAFT_118095 [Setomelanomma holmii]